MCGRYEFDQQNSLLAHFYARAHDDQAQTGTIFPGEKVVVLGLNAQGAVRTTAMRWGFTGFKPSQLLINARSETITVKPTFASTFQQQRCLFPMTQFYEWSVTKDKYLFGANDPLLVAGCYQMKQTPYGLQPQAIILTQAANATVSPIHQRMPVVIAPKDARTWLRDLDFATTYLTHNHAPELIAEKVPAR